MHSIFHTISAGQLILSLAVILVILNTLFFSEPFKRFLRKNMAGCVLTVYLTGFVLYLVGFWYGASGNIVSASLRAALASLEMFASKSELIEVSEHLKEDSVLYMLIFSVTHFAAVSFTLLFILDLFGKRILSYLEAVTLSVNRKGRKLYLFDGVDENSLALASTLPQTEGGRVIIFIKGTVDSDIKEFSIPEMLMSGIKHANKKIDIPDSYVLNRSIPLAFSAIDKNAKSHKRLLNLLGRFTSPEVFFLSQDAEMNADASYALSQEMRDKGQEIKIYAGVSMNAPYSYKLVNEPNVIPLTRSQLKVSHLLESTPILNEGFDKDTLIIGFGHTGRKCMKELFKAGFKNVTALDPQMDSKQEHFLCFNPQIAECEGYKFVKSDTKSDFYWKFIKENLQNFKNVIVFDKTDSGSYSTAVKLLEYAILAGLDIDDMRIYVAQDNKASDIYAQSASQKNGLKTQVLFPFGDRTAIYDYRRFC